MLDLMTEVPKDCKADLHSCSHGRLCLHFCLGMHSATLRAI